MLHYLCGSINIGAVSQKATAWSSSLAAPDDPAGLDKSTLNAADLTCIQDCRSKSTKWMKRTKLETRSLPKIAWIKLDAFICSTYWDQRMKIKVCHAWRTDIFLLQT
ncbi:hypothetical protein RRG08_001075 [Elysia crispata]|uniref:Uncharacterized protein n=1 Tax=Elysia crispata TaxID=231223 RepID=A0AAE1AVZ2_9GAST|nr:hypothetical protein RRG08_001075 [Elysia crispata]